MAGLAKEFRKVVDHQKIIGFGHEDHKQYIIYAVADPEFVRPLLGDAAVDFIREKCKMYYRPTPKSKFMRFYTFIWFTDSGMELFDKAYKENLSMAAIKRKMTEML